jgi:hypothetical protein
MRYLRAYMRLRNFDQSEMARGSDVRPWPCSAFKFISDVQYRFSSPYAAVEHRPFSEPEPHCAGANS